MQLIEMKKPAQNVCESAEIKKEGKRKIKDGQKQHQESKIGFMEQIKIVAK